MKLVRFLLDEPVVFCRYFMLLIVSYISCLDLEKIKAYIDSFRFGAPPHGGGGIGDYKL